MADAHAPDWRGVAAEDVDDVSASLGAFLRGRSKKLLFSLLSPYKSQVGASIGVILTYNLCTLAGPWLVKLAIDDGIGDLVNHRGATKLVVIVTLFVTSSVIAGLADYEFTKLTGRIGQNVLLELRRRLFDHFQRLSLSFHESYTSGRVISRLTSDVEALAELLEYGLTTLSWAVLFLIGITVLMFLLDVKLALVAGVSRHA